MNKMDTEAFCIFLKSEGIDDHSLEKFSGNVRFNIPYCFKLKPLLLENLIDGHLFMNMTSMDLERLSSRNPFPFGTLKKLELLLTKLHLLNSTNCSSTEHLTNSSNASLDKDADEDAESGEEEMSCEVLSVGTSENVFVHGKKFLIFII